MFKPPARQAGAAPSNAVIEAALAGHGVALVRRPLVARELAAHRLLAVKAPPLRTPLAYHLVYRAQTLTLPAMRAFFDWLLTQAGQPVEIPAPNP
jgi:LysR family glycine cleavage system transcriptional activator